MSDLYKTMYPYHLMHFNPAGNHIEGRTYSHPSSYNLFRVMSRNGGTNYNHRKDFLMHSHSAVNLPQNASKHMQTAQSNSKIYYTKREYWNSKNQGKSRRLV